MSGIQTQIELNDHFSSVLNYVINSVNLAVGSMYDLQESMNASIDTSSIEGARDEINQAAAAIMAMNEALNSQSTPEAPPRPSVIPQPPPVEAPVEWQTDSLDTFAGAGMERFRQEVQSANNMLEQLCNTQDAIAQQAYSTMLFSPEAFQDLNALAVRIDTVRDRIQQIENNPVNFGTDTANAELERLRGQLSRMVQEQSELSNAMQNMDVSAANDSYLRLSQTVSETEMYIRDNVDEQGRFNREIQAGTQQVNELTNMIKRAVGAYVSIQSIGKVLSISDELAQTTARLNMMNDGLQSTPELVNMVYASAQSARGSFSEMASVVARFGNNARDAFGSSEEVVAFAELVQKQMTIAGAGTQEASNAMLQLSQALGSGVLRGDELNSIFEQAPNLIQSIADYLDVPIGEIRDMASEGRLSADVVKAAIFASADEINDKFNEMPMTWGQIWQSMQNTALIAFQPVLQRINELGNSEAFQGLVNGAIEALAVLAGITLEVFDALAGAGEFIADNWSIIEPLIWGVAAALIVYNATAGIAWLKTIQQTAAHIAGAVASGAHAAAVFLMTAAQQGLNAALAACPLSWIIIMIIALIAIIFAVCNAIAKTTGIANSGFGVITGGINVVLQFFKNLGLTVANIALGIGGAIAALASNMMTAFHNAICSIQSWFYNLLSTALSVVAGICEALNKLPFIEFDYSGISNAADEYAAKAEEAAGNKGEYKDISDAFNKGMTTFDTFQDGWAGDAFAAGAAWGDGVADKVSNFNLADFFGIDGIPDPEDSKARLDDSDIGDNLDSIAGDTGAIKDSMDITQEDLKYLRDIAEQEAINRFTIAEITIDQSGMQNNINSGDDFDGVMAKLTDSVYEAVGNMAEGVHA